MVGSVANLMVKIGGDISNLEKNLSKAERKIEDVGRKMKRVGQQLTMGLTLPMAAVGGAAIKAAADFESLEQSMNILNGSVEEGARNFRRLKRFSAETPFQLQDLAKAQNMLQGFGLSADQAFQSMSMIGDIAAVTGGSIQEIGVAFGQAAAEGRLMTRDIRQLINQGVPAIKLLADTMNVAQSDVLDLASQGRISFDILIQAFQDATTEGGMFANGMEKQADTLAGIWSTLKDNVSIALGELGNTIVETFDLKKVAKTLIGDIKIIVQRFSEMSQESREQVLKIAALFAAGGPVLFALGQAAIAITAFAKLVRSRFALITAAVSLAIGRFVQVQQLWENFVSRLNNEKTKEVDGFFGALKKGLSGIMEWTGGFADLNAGLEEFQNLISGLGGGQDPDDRLDSIVKRAKEAKDVFKDMDGGANIPEPPPMPQVPNIAPRHEIMPPRGLTEDINQANDLSRALAKTDELIGSVDSGITQTGERITQVTQKSSKLMVGLFQTLDSVFQQAVLHGNKLGNILGKIAKQLASKALINGLAMLVGGAKFKVGKLLFGGVGDILGLAEGGLAFGPTLATVGDNKGARSNPEVIAPLDKLQGMMAGMGGSQKVVVEGKLRGSDLYVSSERGKNKFR